VAFHSGITTVEKINNTDTFMKMRLNDTDLTRIITACKLYQDKTGSEWMWEQYDDLIYKLRIYQEEHCLEDAS